MPLCTALVAVLLAARCLAAAGADGTDPAPGPVPVIATEPATATAGPDSCLLLGQRVRVRYEERGHEGILPFLRIRSTRRGEIVGEMVGGDAREFRVRTGAGEGAEAIVAADLVVSIDRSVGRRRATATGLRTGALLGLCVTPLAWYAAGQGDDGVDWLPTAAWTVGCGAAVGALCGLLGHEDLWARVDRGCGISVAPVPDAGAPKVCLLITRHFD